MSIKKVWTVQSGSYINKTGINEGLEILTMRFRLAQVSDAAQDVANEAKHGGSHVDYYAKRCAKIREQNADRSTHYFNDFAGIEDFSIRAQRNTRETYGREWYGFKIDGAELIESTVKALAKLVSAMGRDLTVDGILATLQAQHVMYGDDSNVWLRCDRPKCLDSIALPKCLEGDATATA